MTAVVIGLLLLEALVLGLLGLELRRERREVEVDRARLARALDRDEYEGRLS